MQKSKIDWCDMSWNPITGCLHGCDYCYAKRIARRFCNNEFGKNDGLLAPCDGNCKDCSEMNGLEFVGDKIRIARKGEGPYPYGFFPTFHKYRLDELKKIKKPRKIFIGSMTDLFGEWVPNDWIDQVFQACFNADRHAYMFLTKNPGRYDSIIDYISGEERGFEPELWNNFWFGTTVTCQNDVKEINDLLKFKEGHKFISVEPLFGEINLSRYLKWPICKYWNPGGNPREYGQYHWEKQKLVWSGWHGLDWVIVGAETGRRSGKVTPKKEWILNLKEQCRKSGTPIFMKRGEKQKDGTYFMENLMGEDFIQEYPWEV